MGELAKQFALENKAPNAAKSSPSANNDNANTNKNNLENYEKDFDQFVNNNNKTSN